MDVDALLDRTPRQLVHVARRRLRQRAPLPRFDGAHPAIFALSTGRVGTQTIAALLRACPGIDVHHEPAPLLFGVSRAAWELEAVPGTEEAVDVAVRSLRRDLLEDALRRGRGYAETSPQGTFLARSLARAVPEVRFLHVVRHPEAVVASGVRRGWYAGHRSDPWRLEPRRGTPAADAWPSWSQVRRIAWLWAETNRWIVDATDGLPAHRVARVRSEDLFAGDPAALGSLWQLAGSTAPPPARVERTLRRQLNASPGGPAALSPAERAEVAEEAGPVADALGYPG